MQDHTEPVVCQNTADRRDLSRWSAELRLTAKIRRKGATVRVATSSNPRGRRHGPKLAAIVLFGHMSA